MKFTWKQRLTTVLTTLFVIFGASALTACNDFLGNISAPVLLYELAEDGKGVEVVGYKGAIQTAKIEESYQGFSVIKIREDAFKNCDSLKTVTMPNSIVDVGANAFADCDNLTTVNFSDRLYVIGDNAFYHCDKLSNVTLNDSVHEIGAGAFSACKRLTLKTYDNGKYLPSASNPYFALHSTVDSNAFGMRLHENTQFILSGAFDGCTALAMLDMPANVQSIHADAFTDCEKLKTVYYHGTKTEWEALVNAPLSPAKTYFYSETAPTVNGDFWHYVNGIATPWEITQCAHNWTITTVPPTCTTQGYDEKVCSACGDSEKFNYTDPVPVHYEIINGVCVKCNTFVGTAGVTYENKGTYAVVTGYTGTDTKVYIHDTFEGVPVTSIGDSAFVYCTSLTSITIPDSVTSIGDTAFSNCTSLTSITIPDSVTSIGDTAFFNCTSLTSVVIPDSVTSIGDEAFENCTSLTSITIPNGVTSIGDGAFWNCDSLTSIAIPDSVASIGRYAFSNCTSLTSVVIPDSVTSIGYAAFAGCSNLMNISVGVNNTAYQSIDGNLYSKDGTTLVQYAIGKADTSFTIPNSVTSIGDYAFHKCSSLTSITIPDSVTSIGNLAFYNCTSLTSVVIGDSVTSIGYAAFAGCSNLMNISVGVNNTAYQSIDGNLYSKDGTTLVQYAIGKADTSFTIPNSVTSIGNRAFYECTSLTSVVIGDSVTSIGYDAFNGCTSLTSITIPDSVTSIGYYAFENCTNLTSVYYKGTESDWANISIDSSNSYLKNATRYYYSEKQPTTEGNWWHYDENGVPTVWETVAYSVGLKYALNSNNESYTVIALGECTDTVLNIPSTYKGLPVTSIGEYAFESCYNLASVVIPDSVTSISGWAFFHCNRLTEIVIPDSVTFIGHRVFSYCSSLTSVIVPDSVTFIGEYAFYNCTNLTIYCEEESQPSGWNLYWNYPIRPVVWGYTGE